MTKSLQEPQFEMCLLTQEDPVDQALPFSDTIMAFIFPDVSSLFQVALYAVKTIKPTIGLKSVSSFC